MSDRTTPLEDRPLPVRTRLAVAWAAFALLYAYVDILHLYTPGVIDELRAGRVFEFAMSQTFSTSALALVSVPILMVVASVTLPARAARTVTLVVSGLYVPVTVFNLAGASWWVFYGLGVVLELVVLALVVRWAWTWPRASAVGSPAPRSAVAA